MSKGKIESITLLGSSSGRNAGDAALVGTIMDSIDLACGERLLYEIPSIKPDFIYRSYKNRVRAIGMWPWNLSIKMLGVPTYRSIMRTDLSLVFDAVLFDRSLYNPAFNYLSSLYLCERSTCKAPTASVSEVLAALTSYRRLTP